VQCGPLSSVVNFSELIGAESDHTPKRKIVHDDMVYKCANIKKCGAREVFVSADST
jgi:hypothetical protein